VFLIADPVILFPGTIKYFFHYVGEGMMTHHGYLMRDISTSTIQRTSAGECLSILLFNARH